jgi:tetratricopeptide (TPR) repeat protein
MSRNHPNSTRYSVGLLVIALICVVAFIVVHNIWAVHAQGQSHVSQAESHDVGSQMVTYTKEGEYDKAVRAGLQALRNRPSDDYIYQQISSVYLIRAQVDMTQREHWIDEASFYIEKALSVHSKDEDVAGVELFQIAKTLEQAGNLSTTSRCKYLQHAKSLLENRRQLLHGDQLVLEGKSYPLGPLRNENEKALTEVEALATNARCK